MKYKNKSKKKYFKFNFNFNKSEIFNLSLISKFIFPLIFLLIAGIVLVLLQWAYLIKRGNNFRIGKPSPETYRVISRIRYDDQASANSLRSMVSDSIVGVIVQDVSARTRLQKRLEALRDMKESTPKNTGYLAIFPEALLNAVLKLNDEEKAKILNNSFKIGSSFIDTLEKQKVFRGNASLISQILWNEINKENFEPKEANFIYQILARLGNLTIKLDADLTKLARQAAVDDVPIMDRKLEPGDVIIGKGETVTREIAALLRLQGYTEDVFPVIELITVILSVLTLPLFINILNKGAGEQKPTWWCIVFIMLTAWISETIAARVGIYGAGSLAGATVAYLCLPDYFAFCLSIAAVGSGVFVISSQVVAYKFMLMGLGVFASMVGFYFLRKCDSRSQLSARILLMSFLMTLVKMSMRNIQGPPFVQDNFRLFIPLGEFWQEAGMFFLYELFVTQIVLLVLQYLESSLDTLSILTIREISHPSNPLLRDLQRNAPGTYQHSLTIATLIEAVGLKLGMDTNLLRAGAYYHDIGKIRKPHYFVENQGGGTNLHDEMIPTLSSLTIISHVKDGLELAWKAKLPKRIRDFIAEHHGTTSTRYFYNKAVAEAKENGKGEKVEWSSFCYPGPKPQSRETALLMIVDSVEAAVRAANIREIEDGESNTNREQDKTSSAIEKIVTQVINSKINEHQFDDVHLTFKDLDIIKQTLVSVLRSMYHTRKVKKINKN